MFVCTQQTLKYSDKPTSRTNIEKKERKKKHSYTTHKQKFNIENKILPIRLIAFSTFIVLFQCMQYNMIQINGKERKANNNTARTYCISPFFHFYCLRFFFSSHSFLFETLYFLPYRIKSTPPLVPCFKSQHWFSMPLHFFGFIHFNKRIQSSLCIFLLFFIRACCCCFFPLCFLSLNTWLLCFYAIH